MVDQGHAAPSPASLGGAHHARAAGADNDYVVGILLTNISHRARVPLYFDTL